VETEVIKVNPLAPDEAVISRAAELIRGGGLVAFPTETVYGLGANALDSAAVQKIFEAKGRPATNPLIVHVSDSESARQIVAEWPESAQRLADRFWPGPLTLVLHRSEQIPRSVTAGGDTVGIRVPRHPVALALLRSAAVPIAAPSANRSSRVSPTSAEHVIRSLGGRIPLVLDSGRALGGLESTVLDLTESPARILRPGLVTATSIEEIIGSLARSQDERATAVNRSPGMMQKHYAPLARLTLALPPDDERLVREACERGTRVGWLSLGVAREHVDGVVSGCGPVGVHHMPEDAREYASRLYSSLHDLDQWGAEEIIAALPPESEEWLAIRDRLMRAAYRGNDGS